MKSQRKQRKPLNAIEQLAARLREAGVPNVDMDVPDTASSDWFLDISKGRHCVTVQWKPGSGFGISAERAPGLGEGPHEVVSGIAAATEHVLELLESGRHTRPPAPLPFSKLRDLRGISQRKLAEGLGVQQAAVSKQEQRTDVLIGSLRAFVRALGGEVRIVVSFPDGVARTITFDPGDGE